MNPAKRKAKRKVNSKKIELTDSEDALLTLIAKIVVEIIVAEEDNEEAIGEDSDLNS